MNFSTVGIREEKLIGELNKASREPELLGAAPMTASSVLMRPQPSFILEKH